MRNPDILNWRRIDERVTTSGQPTEDELVALSDLGVTTIINLGPHSNKGALDNEPASVAALGMAYVYIPVDFDAPTAADFEQFCKAMEDTQSQNVHVHCIYNARVSAFFYLYLQKTGAMSEPDARILMDSIWKPGGVWAEFIGDFSQRARDHLYAEDGY